VRGVSWWNKAVLWLLRLIEATLRGQFFAAFRELVLELVWEPMVFWYGPEKALNQMLGSRR